MPTLQTTVAFLASRPFELVGLPFVAAFVLAGFKILRKPRPLPPLSIQDLDVGFDMLSAAIFGILCTALSLANELLKQVNAAQGEIVANSAAFYNLLRLGIGWTLALWVLAIAVSEYGWSTRTELNPAGIFGPIVVSVAAFVTLAYSL